MNINPNIIKKIILIIACIIIGLILCVIIINHTKEKEISKENFQTDTEITYTDNTKKVTQETMFYTVESCINKYYGYISQNKYKDETDIDNEFSEEDLQTSEKLRLKALYNLLNKQYVSDNYITQDNIKEFVNEYDIAVKFEANTMNVLEGENISVYSVYGQVENYYTSEKIEDVYFVIELDEKINTFSVKPINNVNTINDIKLEIQNEDVESNEDNKFTYTRVTEEGACQKYFDIYKKLMLTNQEEAFNYLDEQYRNKRFENVDNFKKYISANYEELSGITLRKYLVNEYDDYIEYVCRDQYENTYIFNVSAVKEYTAKLDTYTITTQKFLESYENASIEEKVQMNVDKWFLMLNNRDYHGAYSVLDETFRNENFGSEEEFEAYMREMNPLHYEIILENFTVQSDVYTQQVQYYDITGQEELKNQNTIIMQLKEGTDFVMSFYVRKH